MCVWDLTATNKLTVLAAKDRAQLVCSPDGTRLAIGTTTDCELWKAGTWRLERPIRRKRPSSRSALVAFAPTGTALAFTTADATIELVETAIGASLA